MYREALIDQWINLYSDFSQNYDMLKIQGKEPDVYNQWYMTRIHRWNSVSYSEGIMLDQLNQPDFSRELRAVLKEFCFQTVETSGESPVWRGPLIGLAVGVAAAVGMKVLQWGTLRASISGIILFAVVTVAFQNSAATSRKQEQERIKNGYVEQLKNYENILKKICEKYGVH